MEDKLELGEVAEIVQQMEYDGRAQKELFQKIDDAMNCVFTPDAAIENLPYAKGRHFASTEVADARNAGTRSFSSLLPDIRISPVQENQGEYDRVEKMEQAWKWEMEKMNRPVNGKKGFHDSIVESAITYHKVALQTEYLPYKFKGKESDPRIKSILRRKCFNWVVHHPGSVQTKYSDYGLESVHYSGKFTAQQIIENFGKDNEGVQKFLLENEGKKKSELMKMEFTLHDYTDWNHRVQYVSTGGTARYELMNELHGLPFIPWVVVDYGDPLWQSIIDSGLWNNLQHMLFMNFSKAVATGMRSDLVVETTDGKLDSVWIDYENPLNPIVIGPGNKVYPLPSNNLDVAFTEQLNSMRENVARSTVARILQDTSQYANAPFSSLNAAITTALGQLSPAKKVAESAEAEAIFQGFQWIKHSKIPFYAFRQKDGDGAVSTYNRGEHIIITHEVPPTEEELMAMSPEEVKIHEQKIYFDTDYLYVGVELKSANVADEQAKLNMLINAKREFGMSEKEAWERMGWDGYNINKMQRASEILFDTELANAQRLKQLEVENVALQSQIQIQNEGQMQAQQAQMMQQQEMMAQQQQQAATPQNMNGSQFAGLEGVDMRGGGMPAAMQAPNGTREQVSGMTQSGDPTAL